MIGGKGKESQLFFPPLILYFDQVQNYMNSLGYSYT